VTQSVATKGTVGTAWKTAPLGSADLIDSISDSMKVFAKWLARGGDLDADDLYQEGAIEAIKAIERYDPECGAKLSTFCLRRAKGAMVDAMRSYDECYRKHSKTVIAVKSAISSIVNERAWTNAFAQKFRESLEPSVCDPEPQLTQREFVSLLRRAFRLSSVRARLLTMYFHAGLKMREIADEWGVSETLISHKIKATLAEITAVIYGRKWDRNTVSALLEGGQAA
jgi:RNA polymerase sigma factor (sigma-70 family)